jgi:hypothetical protein
MIYLSVLYTLKNLRGIRFHIERLTHHLLYLLLHLKFTTKQTTLFLLYFFLPFPLLTPSKQDVRVAVASTFFLLVVRIFTCSDHTCSTDFYLKIKMYNITKGARFFNFQNREFFFPFADFALTQNPAKVFQLNLALIMLQGKYSKRSVFLILWPLRAIIVHHYINSTV